MRRPVGSRLELEPALRLHWLRAARLSWLILLQQV
jgi:hypothetical protein